MNKRVAIIGGGAAGLFCANIMSKNSSALTIDILEKNDRVGKKLLATGNGQCNISNANINAERYYCVDENSRNSMLMLLEKYPGKLCMNHFREIGVEIVEAEDGKLYPAGKQASAVLDLLRIENERLNVNEICSFNVKSVLRQEDGFLISSHSNQSLTYDVVVVCGGSEASPKLGGTSSSYDILSSFGHSSTLRYPTLAAAKTDTSKIKLLRGQKITAKISLLNKDETVKSVYGELLFTEYGLSGPPIFQLTGHAEALRSIDKGKELSFSIDFLPDIPLDMLVSMLQKRVVDQGHKTLENFLSGWFNKQLGRSLFSAIDIRDQSRIAYTLSEKNLLSLSKIIRAWRIQYIHSRGFEYAQVCAGGIILSEFDDRLQSSFSKGLYAAGEVLDAHADSGGFNLQWAWSSAFCVANSIVEKYGD